MPITRRRFIQAGLAGTTLLAVAGAYEIWRVSRHPVGDPGALTPAGRAIFAALLPAFLDGVVPETEWTQDLTARTVDAIEVTVQGLALHARAELDQLIALLDHRGARALLAGPWTPWRSVRPPQARAFLQRWRYSRFTLLASSYQALHDISCASWYGDPAHWPATGYPGPPRVEAPQA